MVSVVRSERDTRQEDQLFTIEVISARIIDDQHDAEPFKEEEAS